jgi:uncharacterized protein
MAGAGPKKPEAPPDESALPMSKGTAHYPGIVPIDAYGNGGFRFAGMSHRGSILCLPSGIYAWQPAEPLDLESLAPALAETGAMRVLILGTGARQVFPPPAVRRAFVESGLALEPMDTGAACRTYNVLLAEGRSVGAALVAVE